MGRSSSRSENDGMKKGVWTAGEDEILVDYVKKHGQGKWGRISKETGLRRCGKSVRLRWLNYLRPDIKRCNIAEDEEELIIRLHKLLGNRWSLIAGRIPGRTDNEIKNYWNSTLRRKLELQNPIKEDDPDSTSKNVDQPTSSSFTNHNIVKEEDPHHLQPCHHLGSTTTATDTTTFLSGATIEANNKNDVKLTVDVDLGDDDDDATWNDFIMDLNQAQLDITEFLQTDFSKLCESASTPPMDGC